MQLFTAKFSSTRQFLRWKLCQPNVKFEKENRRKPSWYINFLFSTNPLVYINIFTDEYYPSNVNNDSLIVSRRIPGLFTRRFFSAWVLSNLICFACRDFEIKHGIVKSGILTERWKETVGSIRACINIMCHTFLGLLEGNLCVKEKN